LFSPSPYYIKKEKSNVQKLHTPIFDNFDVDAESVTFFLELLEREIEAQGAVYGNAAL